MAHYLVRAKPVREKLTDLKRMLDQREIIPMRPFGNTLHHSLEHARLEPEGWAVWEEEDYCHPPLAQERAAVLDEFFTQLTVQAVQPEKGWEQIQDLPRLWGSKA